MRKKRIPGRKSRRSSSDTDTEIDRVPKRSNTMSQTEKTNGEQGKQQDEVPTRSVNEIYDRLLKVGQNQESLRQSL